MTWKVERSGDELSQMFERLCEIDRESQQAQICHEYISVRLVQSWINGWEVEKRPSLR